MIYNGKEIEFPAILHTSFYKVVDSLEKHSANSNGIISAFAKKLLDEVSEIPELRSGVADVADLSKYQKTIEKLSDLLFPDALERNEIKILTPPFQFQPIRTSRRFDNIVKASGKPFNFVMEGVDADMFYLYCCYYIMGSYYGYPGSTSNFQKIEIFDEKLGLNRVYKVLINADLCEFIPTDRAVDITYQDYMELLDGFDNIELWKKKFPPNSWIMKGLTVVNLVDITSDHSISSITSNLLVKDDESMVRIKDGIRSLLQDARLEIGVLTINNQMLLSMQGDVISSMILKAGESLDCQQDMCDYAYNQLMIKHEPLIVTDTVVFHERSSSALSRRIVETKFKSYIIAPIIHEGEMLGLMEIGALNKYQLHKGTIDILNEVLPVLAMAHKRFMDEFQNRIEAIIQQECTTIHESVKWRFEEEAISFITKEKQGEQPVFKDIVFKNLYPLYGQLDIKGSSERRNKAVTTDLIKQIRSVRKVLEVAMEQKKMPVIDQLLYKLDAYKIELSNQFSAGSEHKLINFLEKEVYPVFENLSQIDTTVKIEIDRYHSLLDPELKSVYEKRSVYDQMVNQVNHRLANYIDKKQQEAQEIFPHYFERYKTDGVEFNMYIGQSITKDAKFHEIYLKNLRLWQLVVMCEMEQEFRSIKQEFNSSIEIASLVLVYNTPLAVHFRMDEKQFDVEGAYNARYEIIKKRVDKARIKGTKERITKPGSLVIVYSQEQDAQEYQTYLEFLAFKGYLKSSYENLVLEDLQGVHGLRALRVEIAQTEPMSIDQLIEEVSERIQ